MRFTWDDNKAAANLRKHGVSFEEAATAFDDMLAIIVPDAVHPERLLLVGMSVKGRVLVTVHIEAEENEVVRIISAREATRHERRRYEEGTH